MYMYVFTKSVYLVHKIDIMAILMLNKYGTCNSIENYAFKMKYQKEYHTLFYVHVSHNQTYR